MLSGKKGTVLPYLRETVKDFLGNQEREFGYHDRASDGLGTDETLNLDMCMQQKKFTTSNRFLCYFALQSPNKLP